MQLSQVLEVGTVLIDQILTHCSSLVINLAPDITQALGSFAAFFCMDNRDIPSLLLPRSVHRTDTGPHGLRPVGRESVGSHAGTITTERTIRIPGSTTATGLRDPEST